MTGPAAVASCSFGGLKLGHGFERVEFVPPRKSEKRLLARVPVREISLQDALNGARRVFRDDVAIKFAAERGVRPEAAADEDVIALYRIGILVRLHLAGEQADLGDEMLGARVMA